MNKKLQIKRIVWITIIIQLYLLTNCAETADTYIEQTESQYKNTLDVSNESVWNRNKYATKVSQSYLLYSGTHHVYALFGLPGKYSDPIGTGYLSNGFLSFSVNQLKLEEKQEEILLDWNDFKEFFNVWDKESLRINGSSGNSTIKGNMLLLDAFTQGDAVGGFMDRQRIIGEGSSLKCETILYFYLSDDCTIIGKPNKGYVDGLYYYLAGHNLDLSFKKGWNLVTRTEKYSTDISGYATISMEIKPIKNPQDYKWVIEKGFRF